MGFNVTKVKEVVKPAFVPFDDGSKLNFTFYPNKYTPQHEQKIDEIRKGEGNGGDTLKAWLLPLLHSWDAEYDVQKTDDKGELVWEDKEKTVPVMVQLPVPLDEVGMDMMPMEVLGEVLSEMIDAMKPGEKKSTNSRGSFS